MPEPVERFGYLEENIQIMLDDSEDNSQPTHPSKANIVRNMRRRTSTFALITAVDGLDASDERFSAWGTA